jgi:hypothetical protein
MLVFMPEKIFDLLFTLPRGGTRLTTHVHLLVISVAKVSPSLPRSTAIIRFPKAIRSVNPRLLPDADCFVANAHHGPTRPDQIPKNPLHSAAGSRQPTPRSSRAKPALVDFVVAEFDRFADRARLSLSPRRWRREQRSVPTSSGSSPHSPDSKLLSVAGRTLKAAAVRDRQRFRSSGALLLCSECLRWALHPFPLSAG